MKFSIFNKNQNDSDEDLVKRFQKSGDIEILGELYNRYLELSMGLCMKYTKDKQVSEDLVMEIFELLVKRLPNHDVGNFKSWLYRVASNHCLDYLRKQKRVHEKDKEFEFMYSREINRLDNTYLNQEMNQEESLLKRMEICLEKLITEQKRCVDLFYLQGKSYKEVSSIMNISWSKTRSYIQNGRRNLKICMEENE